MYGVLNILNGSAENDVKFNLSGLTTSRILNIRDVSGTVALLSDITTGGITNSAPNGSLMLSDGTNAIDSGVSVVSSNLVLGTSNSKLSIGTTATTYNLDVASSGNTAARIRTTGSGGVDLILKRDGGTASEWNIYLPSSSSDLRFYSGSDKFIFSTSGVGSANNWSSTSDIRLKTNIKKADSQKDKVKDISKLVVNFDWIENNKNDIGFIAQDLLKIAPEFVNVPTDENEMLSINYGKMVSPLYSVIAELMNEIELLKNEINLLKNK